MGIFDWLRGKPSAPATASAAATPEELFVRDLETRLRRMPRVTAVDRIPDEPMALRVTANETGMTLFLGNLFSDTRELEPERREAQIQRYLRGAIERPSHPSTWAEAEPLVALALRGPFAVNGVGDAAAELAAREVVPCLREHLVVDTPDNIAFLRADELRDWSVSYEAAAAVARARLARSPTGEEPYDAAQGIWTVDTGDDYESARLLVPGFLSSFVGRVDGAPIAVVPTRNQLFVAGDANPAVVERLVALAQREFAASPRRVSAALYSAGPDGALCRYLRAGDDACARAVRSAHVHFEGGEYTGQKELLEPRFLAAGEDVFVASFSGMEHPHRGVFSWCSWTPGIVSLLPRTDLVAVPPPEAGFVLVPWDALVRVAGAKLQLEPGLYPFRWRTVGTLDEADLRALQAVEFKPDA